MFQLTHIPQNCRTLLAILSVIATWSNNARRQCTRRRPRHTRICRRLASVLLAFAGVDEITLSVTIRILRWAMETGHAVPTTASHSHHVVQFCQCCFVADATKLSAQAATLLRVYRLTLAKTIWNDILIRRTRKPLSLFSPYWSAR